MLTVMQRDSEADYVSFDFSARLRLLRRLGLWTLDRLVLVLDRTNQALTSTILRASLSGASARIGYATEGALFISAQLSTDAVNVLRKVRVLILL